MTCLSARRVPEAGGVCSLADVPEGVERENLLTNEALTKATTALAEKQAAVGAFIGGGQQVGCRCWKSVRGRAAARTP